MTRSSFRHATIELITPQALLAANALHRNSDPPALCLLQFHRDLFLALLPVICPVADLILDIVWDLIPDVILIRETSWLSKNKSRLHTRHRMKIPIAIFHHTADNAVLLS